MRIVNTSRFTIGEALNTAGVMTSAWGFTHDGVFVVNAFASECGRFHQTPEFYGLTRAEALELAQMNEKRELMAYWNI